MKQRLRRRRSYGSVCAMCGTSRLTLGGRRYSWLWSVENIRDGVQFADIQTFCSKMCRAAFK